MEKKVDKLIVLLLFLLVGLLVGLGYLLYRSRWMPTSSQTAVTNEQRVTHQLVHIEPKPEDPIIKTILGDEFYGNVMYELIGRFEDPVALSGQFLMGGFVLRDDPLKRRIVPRFGA